LKKTIFPSFINPPSLLDNVRELFPEIQESSAKGKSKYYKHCFFNSNDLDLDESEYEEGLPLVLNKFIRNNF